MYEIVRVTQALDHFKAPWYIKWVLKVGIREANLTSKKALVSGSRLHEIIASGKYEAEKKDSQEVKQCLKNFLKWMDRYQVTGIVSLSRRTDEVIGLSGEPDFYWPAEDTLVDIKTSKFISPDNFLQLGGYKRLGYPGTKLAILRLGKEDDDMEYLTNEKLGISVESCIDAYESVFKHYRYYTWLESKLKGDE